MDYSPLGSSVPGIFQASILVWIAISFSSDLPKPGIEPGSPALQADSLPTELQGKIFNGIFSSVQFSHSVMSDSLRPHELQHARPPCPSPTPGDHSDSRPSIPSSPLILCRPLLLLPLIPPSIRVFSTESSLHMRWPKYWSCSFSIILPKKSQG